MVEIPADAILRLDGRATIDDRQREASADPEGLDRFARHRLFTQLADALERQFGDAIAMRDGDERRVYEIALFVLKPEWVKAQVK